MQSGGCVVGEYRYTSAALRRSDRRAEEAARRVGALVAAVDSRLSLEHVGSTAVPGLRGKGIVDLVVLYPDGLLARAREVLDGLGFQRQNFGKPFPEERPMRVGCVDVDGLALKLHVHVVAATSQEASDMLLFRDRLRSDPRLRRAYVDYKKQIIAEGITESPDYAERKGIFIKEVLAQARAGR